MYTIGLLIDVFTYVVCVRVVESIYDGRVLFPSGQTTNAITITEI